MRGAKNVLTGIMFMIMGVGINTTISTSNTKNSTANKKNRKENGIRALDTGLNPHSNGLNVSRSFHDRLEAKDIEEKIIIKAIGIIVARIKGNNVIIIWFN